MTKSIFMIIEQRQIAILNLRLRKLQFDTYDCIQILEYLNTSMILVVYVYYIEMKFKVVCPLCNIGHKRHKKSIY